ncbi:MAG: N-acetyltransferase [Crocinitomicaceae bacterium]|nr:N-acetyltransferase [Crocinitomicaceae bacterium]
MTSQDQEIQMTHNKEKNRFEFDLEDHKKGVVKYERSGHKMRLTHTQIPKEIRGKGYGKTMAEMTLEEIERMRMKVIPQCPFIDYYIENNPKWESLVYHTSSEMN